MSDILTSSNYNLFLQILKMDEKTLLNNLNNLLSKKYNNVICSKDYIYAEGTYPVCVVAHLDTVFYTQPTNIFYDTNYNVMWSPQGLGADDRTGVYMIMQLLKQKLLPSILFTTGEEEGGKGALAFIKDFPQAPNEIKYLIELDRHGSNDCVFYNCGNDNFISFVEKYGFEKNYGTFTDISIVCPSWDKAGVNLSVGYEEEHSYSEFLRVGCMNDTLKKVTQMIKDSKDKKVPNFDYQKIDYFYNKKNDKNVFVCEGCGKVVPLYGGIDVVNKNGKILHYCDDCFSQIADIVGWCEHCFQPYEKTKEDNSSYCFNCRKGVIL